MKNFKKVFAFTGLVKPLFGFTLAEVLITLSILGVVAAITVPSLVNRQYEKEFVTKLKKEFSALQTAFDIAVAENGPIERWDSDYEGVDIEKITKHMNVSKICYDSDDTCALTASYKGLGNQDLGQSFNEYFDDGTRRILLKDGTYFELRYVDWANINSKTCDGDNGHCAELRMDLNGNKGPNKYGVDVFGVSITKNGIVPWGTKNEISQCRVTERYGGERCTAWALYKGNMDYLRKTVSWD